MQQRQLGNSDLHVSPITFGGNVLGWTIDEQQSFKVLDVFVEAGFNFIDTADVYSRWAPNHVGGESETILGNWIKARNNRDKVIIATKVGGDMGEGKTLKKPYILKRVEDSLKRLQTDFIDLYQTHFDDETTPVEETLEAYSELVKAGKVRWIGASNMSTARLTESLQASAAYGFPKYQSFQPEYNLYAREGFEKKYEQICLDNNLGVIGYFSLASGFLTGKYRSEADFGKSVRGSGMGKYLNELGNKILAGLDKVSAEYNTSIASVALAWLIARPSVTAPIASATKVEQVEEFTKAVNLNLSKEDIDLLNEASS